MNVAMYLRKSRADIEAEKQGEMETLRRHKSTLLKVAKEQNLNLVEIKEEIISGESIIHRPKMIELLREVEDDKYDAVLVMDIDRLGRGGMKDQGIILETFKNSNTKIITPQKIYDLDDELDEQYTEFQTFFARQELKTIKKRMLRGRKKSFEEGKFIYSTPPFGYDAVYNTKGERTIVPNENAETVKLIYNLYSTAQYTPTKIAKHLDDMNIKPLISEKWSPVTIRKILKNKVYYGYLSYGRVVQTKKLNENGKAKHKLNKKEDVEYSKGNHQAIISETTYNNVQKIMRSKVTSPNSGGLYAIQNPFSGIMRCKKCGSIMKRNANANGKIYLKCRNECGNRSTQLEFVENKIIKSLALMLKKYQVKVDKNRFKNKYNKNIQVETTKQAILNLEKELKELEKQKNNLYDFFERKIYDDDTFIERSRVIKERTEKTKKKIIELKTKMPRTKKTDAEIAEGLRAVLEVYPHTSSAEAKNKLLKNIIDSIQYYKEDGYKTDQFDSYIKLKLNH